MSYKFLLPVLLFLAACATSAPLPEDVQVLSTKRVVADIAKRPYECYQYDARTDSCTNIAKRSIQGNSMVISTTVSEFVRSVGVMTIDIKTTLEMRNNAFCGNIGDSEVEVSGGVIPSDIRDAALKSTLRNLQRQGEKCYVYLRDGSGQHYSVTRTRDGRLDGSANDKVWFFANPKPVS